MQSDKMTRHEEKEHNAASALNVELQKIKAAQQKGIDDYVSSLPGEQKISQLFLVNIAGNEKFQPVEHTGALYGQAGKGGYLVPGGCLFFSYILQIPRRR